MAIRPIFVFSITRSGSTLVQRVIAAHEGVATASEPWLLLPFLYTLRERGVVAEYTHWLAVHAIEDFCAQLPAGVDDYRQELRALVLRLYAKAAGDQARYFVDKSPPYYFIADEVMSLFPEGKFIFLWRNPLSIVASIIDTWHAGKFRVTANREDLFVGLPRLIATYAAERSRAHAVRFEDLVGEDRDSWRGVMAYLGIEFDPQALSRFGDVALHGRMGDPTGRQRYAALSADPVSKWSATLSNPIRREWCRRYLRFLGPQRLRLMGYDLEQLLGQLDAQPAGMQSLLGDFLRLVDDVAREPVRARNRRHGIGGPGALRALL
ncbi:MAG: sulfotransferase [Solirubrobacteraceae bacterium]